MFVKDDDDDVVQHHSAVNTADLWLLLWWLVGLWGLKCQSYESLNTLSRGTVLQSTVVRAFLTQPALSLLPEASRGHQSAKSNPLLLQRQSEFAVLYFTCRSFIDLTPPVRSLYISQVNLNCLQPVDWFSFCLASWSFLGFHMPLSSLVFLCCLLCTFSIQCSSCLFFWASWTPVETHVFCVCLGINYLLFVPHVTQYIMSNLASTKHVCLFNKLVTTAFYLLVP